MIAVRFFILAVIFMIAILPQSYAKNGSKEVTSMVPEKIEARVLAKDWDVQEEISQADSSLIPVLTKLTGHEDPEIRELAISCLGEFRGANVAETLVKALNDPIGDVRVEAYNMLEQAHHPSILPQLQEVMSTHNDEYVREDIALTIGRIGDPSAIDSLKSNLLSENVGEVQSAITQSLARLGEDEARKTILSELSSDQVKMQWQAMQKLEFVNDQELAVHLKPFLNDPRPAFNTIADPRKVTVRLQDVALKTIAVLFNQPFSFQLIGYRPCSNDELQEGREFMSNR